MVWMRRIGGSAAAALATGLVAAAGTLPISSDWARDPVWDDGKAEVAVYEASRVIYGAPRAYEAVLLTVKEDLDAAKLVKADPPYGNRSIVTVLKQNAVREIPTPNYDYRIMTSTFVEREDPTRLVKLTSGSHEWCGNTWKAIRSRDGHTVYDWSSYFDGESDGFQALEFGPGSLTEDQLPMALRGLDFREGLTFDVRLLPSLANNRGGRLGLGETTILVRELQTISVPAGRTRAWKVQVVGSRRNTTYWFDSAGTHPMVAMESSDGDVLHLIRIERRAYWQLP